MKKAFIFPAFFLALALVLTGCAKSSQTPGQAVGGSNRPGQTRMPDFGQPDRRADVRGVVKSIVGNEVTILKIEMPNRGASSTSDQTAGTKNSGSTASPAISLSGGTARGNAGGRSGAGFAGGSGGPGGTMDTQARAQMLERLKAMSTGEEKIIIPVGIKMLKADTSNNKRTMVEATLADITADKSLTIWTTTPDAAATPTVATTTVSTASTTVAAPAVATKIAEFVLIN